MQHLVAGAVGVDFEHGAFVAGFRAAAGAVERGADKCQRSLGTAAIECAGLELVQDLIAGAVGVDFEERAGVDVATAAGGSVERVADESRDAGAAAIVRSTGKFTQELVAGAIGVELVENAVVAVAAFVRAAVES